MACLHNAAAVGDLTSVQRLLSEGVSIDSVGKCCKVSALFAAVANGNTQVAMYLLNKGADIKLPFGACLDFPCQPLLHVASRKGLMHVVEELIEKRGISLFSKDSYGLTPLQVACMAKEVKIVRYLLEKSTANIDDRSAFGMSPLHHAACEGDSDMISVLLSHGANPNARTMCDMSPLHCFVNGFCDRSTEKQTAAMHMLLAAGADRKQTDLSGYTPLHLVKYASDARLLVEYEYVVLLTGGTIPCEPIDIEKLFNSRDKSGKIPLEITQERRSLFSRLCGLRRELSFEGTIDYLESWISRVTVPVESKPQLDQGVVLNHCLSDFQAFLARRLLRVVKMSLLSEVSEVILGYLTPLDLVNVWWEQGILESDNEDR